MSPNEKITVSRITTKSVFTKPSKKVFCASLPEGNKKNPRRNAVAPRTTSTTTLKNGNMLKQNKEIKPITQINIPVATPRIVFGF